MKHIVISGGSEGLGKALTKALAAKGNKVVILSSNKEKLERVASEAKCSFKVCDITDWQQVNSAVKEIIKESGNIDVLVNNAGVAYGGKIEDIEASNIQHVFDVNVVGALYLIKAVVPAMKKKGDGYIININSQGGLYAKAERSLYGGSKWALTGITKILQTELAPSGIKVSGLYPGAMENSMAKNGIRQPQENSISYQEMIDAVEFILSRSSHTVIPELGIKDLDN